MRALAKCDHPNVVKVLSSGEDAGTPWFSMECIAGADLRAVGEAMVRERDFVRASEQELAKARAARAREHPELAESPGDTPTSAPATQSWPAFAGFFRDAALGVQALHEKGVLHRDLSPANLMVNDGDRRAVVMDLGLAAVEEASVTLTRDKSQILGTLRYIAPEQFTRRIEEIDARADVYSLGAVMYELAAGEALFDGTSEARLMQQILSAEPRPLRSLKPDVPREIEAIVHQALEKKRERRYATMQELAQDLDAVARGRLPKARMLTRAYRLQRSLVRSGHWIGVALVLLIGVVIGRSVLHGDAAAGPSAEGGVQLTPQEVEALRSGSAETKLELLDRLLAKAPDYSRNDNVSVLASGPEVRFDGDRSAVPTPESALGNSISKSIAPGFTIADAENLRESGDVVGAKSRIEFELGLILRVPENEAKPTAARLFEFSSLAMELGAFAAAQPALERLARLTEHAAEDDNLRLQVSENLAWSRHLQGADVEAQAILAGKVLPILQDQWPDATRTQRARLKYALVMRALGDSKTAEEFAQAALDVLEKSRPADDPDRIAAQQLVANVAADRGDLARAQGLLEDVVQVLATRRSSESPELQAARLDLASTLARNGDLPRALHLQDQVLEVRERSLPAEHPDLLRAQQDLAATLTSTGNLKRARALLEQVLEARSRTLPDDHPDLQSTRLNLARVESGLGDLQGARALEERVLEVESCTLPDDHPDRQLTQLNSAVTLGQLGDLPGARALEENVFAVYSRTLPGDHPLLQQARRQLARTLRALGDEEGAKKLEKN